MASKKTKVVDGYTALRAAQEAARHGKGDPLRAGKTTSPPAKEASAPETKKAGSRIGRTVLPSGREIVCPECGFSSEVKGKLSLYVCQPCRHRLKLDDHTLKDTFEGELETGGTITVEAEASLAEGSRIVGNDVVLKGKMCGGELRACRRLILVEGAQPDWERIRFRELEVGAGVALVLEQDVRGMHISVSGSLEGNLELDGCLFLSAGALFKGRVKAAGLVVEEGGGLHADLDINPDYAPKTDERPGAKGKKTK